MAGEIFRRFGTEPESLEKLAAAAAAAEQALGIHAVSVTARETSAPVSVALREEVERHFRVIETPTRKDKLHWTIELPMPVTQEVVDQFNQLFGRAGP